MRVPGQVLPGRVGIETTPPGAPSPPSTEPSDFPVSWIGLPPGFVVPVVPPPDDGQEQQQQSTLRLTVTFVSLSFGCRGGQLWCSSCSSCLWGSLCGGRAEPICSAFFCSRSRSPTMFDNIL